MSNLIKNSGIMTIEIEIICGFCSFIYFDFNGVKLTRRLVVPDAVGSNPIVRPSISLYSLS